VRAATRWWTGDHAPPAEEKEPLLLTTNTNTTMPIYATKPESTEFAKVEPGTYMARCFSMIEIGHIDTEFNGKKKHDHKVMLTWELPEELAVFKEGNPPEPYVVSKTYTLSMYEKATLRKDLESWRGQGFTELEAAKFDIMKLLGVPCLLTITHKPKHSDPTQMFVEVSSIAKLMKGQECPPQINPTKVLSYDKFDWAVYETLSDNMKDKIKKSDEFRALQEPATVHDEQENGVTDDLPF
jgi:hypothetical protein